MWKQSAASSLWCHIRMCRQRNRTSKVIKVFKGSGSHRGNWGGHGGRGIVLQKPKKTLFQKGRSNLYYQLLLRDQETWGVNMATPKDIMSGIGEISSNRAGLRSKPGMRV